MSFQNERLKAENQTLRIRTQTCSCQPSNTSEGDLVPKSEDRMYPVESAALINGPLPQGQGYIQSTILRTFLHLMLILQSLAVLSVSNGKTESTESVEHGTNLHRFRLSRKTVNHPQSLIHIRIVLKHPP